jgi:hypothetical protein
MDWRPTNATCPTYSMRDTGLQTNVSHVGEYGVIHFICTQKLFGHFLNKSMSYLVFHIAFRSENQLTVCSDISLTKISCRASFQEIIFVV